MIRPLDTPLNQTTERNRWCHLSKLIHWLSRIGCHDSHDDSFLQEEMTKEMINTEEINGWILTKQGLSLNNSRLQSLLHFFHLFLKKNQNQLHYPLIILLLFKFRFFNNLIYTRQPAL